MGVNDTNFFTSQYPRRPTYKTDRLMCNFTPWSVDNRIKVVSRLTPWLHGEPTVRAVAAAG